jgi:hypothetical protein
MNTQENLEEKLEKLGKAIGSDDSLVEQVMRRIDVAEASRTYKFRNRLVVRRLIMNRFSKLAAAAVIIIAVALAITVLDKSIAPAYALEQTIQATHSVRYIHTKSFFAPHEEPIEGWIEFDATGTGRNFRIHMPAWTDPWGHDGDKVMIWKDNKASLWAKKKNMFWIAKDNEIADMVFKTTEQFDPKMALIGLQLSKSEGKVDLDIELPEDKAGPIIVTATILEEVTEEQPMTNTERGMAKL